MTFAQDAQSAKYFAMPQSAIVAGWVDSVLPPAAIAGELVRQSHPMRRSSAPSTETQNEMSPHEEQAFTAILVLLRRETGVDFLSYKRPTLLRRLLRRMTMHQIEHFADYLLLLQEHGAEVEAVYQDVLITVTSFFRDPAAFEALTHTVFPALLRSRATDDPIRIWVMGCSTGEEVYSLAMCLHEFLDEASPSTPMLVFATDLNATVLRKARAGVYAPDALLGVSPQRLQRFFLPVEGGYRICQTVRERCVFAHHNVSRDPPFSRLDLVSCRKVLIYLGPVLQRNVLQTFHYALKPHGFLLLGTSETVGGDTDLFSLVDAKQKLYTKKNTRVRFPLAGTPGQGERDAHVPPKEGHAMHEDAEPREADVQQEADHVLLLRYVPSSMVIDADLEILQFRGHTSPYLEPASGKASFNLLKMARDGLKLGLRSAIHAASKSGHAVTKEGLQVTLAGSVKAYAQVLERRFRTEGDERSAALLSKMDVRQVYAVCSPMRSNIPPRPRRSGSARRLAER